MFKRLLDAYVLLLLARPWLSLAVVLGAVAAVGSQIPNLRMEASADTLVLEGDTAYAYYRQTGENFGSEDFLVVTFRPLERDLMSEPSLDQLRALRDELAGLDAVSSVTSMLDVPLLYSPQISFTDIGDPVKTLSDPDTDRELARQEFLNSPIYKNMLLSPDGQETAMQLNLVRDETFETLLAERDRLRDEHAAGALDEAGLKQLEDAEQAFADHSAVAQEAQDKLVADVRSILDRYRDSAQIYLGGVPMIAADMIDYARADLETFGGAMLIVIVVVLSLIFRRWQWVLVPLVTCASTAVFMLGLIALLDWPLTVVSSNFVPLLLILSLAIVIHLINYYRELWEENPEADHDEMVEETIRFMAVPVSYTTATTAVAFASFVASGIKPVIDFGWMMTLGVMSALMMALTLVPVLMHVAGKPHTPPVKPKHNPFSVVMANLVLHRGQSILWGSLALLLMSVYGLSQLEVENRFIDYFDENTEIYQGMETIDRELGGTIPLSVVIDLEEPPEFDLPVAAEDDEFGFDFDDEAETDEFGFDDNFDDGFDDDSGAGDDVNPWFTVYGLDRVAEVHDYLDALPETGKVLSLATVYRVAEDLLGGGVDDIQLAIAWRSLPEEMRDIIINPYLSQSSNQALVSVRVKETSEGLRRDELLKRIHSHLVDDLGFAEDKIHLTNMLVLYNNVLQSLFKSQILTLGLTFLAILIMFVALFRSIYLSLLAILPNLLAAGLVLGTMGLLGIPLDVMTITIAAIVIGIGVDDCIHYVFRFQHEFGIDHDYSAAVRRSHTSIGRAMYYTSVTIVSGFSILVLSNFTPSIYFGLLTAFAMVVAMLGGLLLLPRLLILFKPLGPDAGAQGV